MFNVKEQRRCLGMKRWCKYYYCLHKKKKKFLQRYLNSYNDPDVCHILSTFRVNLGQCSQKRRVFMSGFVPPERPQKMPVPKFFKLILSWSPASCRMLKLTPLCNPGKSDVIVTGFWLFETHSVLAAWAPALGSSARRIGAAHRGFPPVIFTVSFLWGETSFTQHRLRPMTDWPKSSWRGGDQFLYT